MWPFKQKKKPAQLSMPQKIWRFIWRFFLIGFITSLVYLFLCTWLMPPITLTQTNSALGKHGLKRDYVGWDEISPNLKLAAIASEDQLFPDHAGFDWDAIEKSFKAKPKNKNSKRTRPAGSGTSTISQQVAKNVFLWQGGAYLRKAPEAYFTKMIEWTWGKKRILEVYLNVIEMGPGIFGAEAASRAYFNKPAKSLTRKEAAMIIACLPNPKTYTVKPISRWVAWRSEKILIQMHNIEDDEDIRALIGTGVAKKKVE